MIYSMEAKYIESSERKLQSIKSIIKYPNQYEGMMDVISQALNQEPSEPLVVNLFSGLGKSAFVNSLRKFIPTVVITKPAAEYRYANYSDYKLFVIYENPNDRSYDFTNAYPGVYIVISDAYICGTAVEFNSLENPIPMFEHDVDSLYSELLDRR